jgi:hypothetical protein
MYTHPQLSLSARSPHDNKRRPSGQAGRQGSTLAGSLHTQTHIRDLTTKDETTAAMYASRRVAADGANHGRERPSGRAQAVDALSASHDLEHVEPLGPPYYW